MENGCGQRCNAPREDCPHRCAAKCHPGKPCPKIPCAAEMRHYCKCGHRYVVTVCKSVEDRKPLDLRPREPLDRELFRNPTPAPPPVRGSIRQVLSPNGANLVTVGATQLKSGLIAEVPIKSEVALPQASTRCGLKGASA